MLGVIVNTLTVFVGSSIGLLAKKGHTFQLDKFYHGRHGAVYNVHRESAVYLKDRIL